ncbi:MAG: DUF3450 domain-containing protein [Desulforhopalus sp.]
MRCVSCIFSLFIVQLTLFCQVQAGEATEQIKKTVDESINIRQNIQKSEVQWQSDKEKLLARYDELTETAQYLSGKRQALTEKIDNTRSRIAVKQKQLDDIEQIQSEIIPLIASLIVEIEQFTATDLPFLSEERNGRLKRLIEIRDDPEVAVSEKYRKVMEALLVEMEYGNTIEVYQETIAADDREMLVDIFRLGRIALFFQTLDRKSCGFYNVASAAWQPLPTAYNRTIEAAMEIGAKRRPVELLTLPLGRIQL